MDTYTMRAQLRAFRLTNKVMIGNFMGYVTDKVAQIAEAALDSFDDRGGNRPYGPGTCREMVLAT